MPLYKRKGSKIYWLSFTTKDGKRVRKSTGTINKKQAQEYYDRLKADHWREDKFNEKTPRKWEKAVEKYLIEKKGCSSYEDILNEIKILNKFLSNKYLNDIDDSLINEIKDSRRKDRDKRYINSTKLVSVRTVNHTISQLRAILNFACDELKWINSIPEIKLIPIKKSDKYRLVWLTKSEAKTLINELPEHLSVMAQFTLATGLREENVTGLTWDKVDMTNKIAWIDAIDYKTDVPVSVPLNLWAIDILTSQEGKHSNKVFTYNGKSIKNANNYAWRKALDRSKIAPYIPCITNTHQNNKYPMHALDKYKYESFRWHDLRHTWASWHVQSGTPLIVLQQLGGWASYEMVLRYAHLSNGYVDSFSENIPPL